MDFPLPKSEKEIFHPTVLAIHRRKKKKKKLKGRYGCVCARHLVWKWAEEEAISHAMSPRCVMWDPRNLSQARILLSLKKSLVVPLLFFLFDSYAAHAIPRAQSFSRVKHAREINQKPLFCQHSKPDKKKKESREEKKDEHVNRQTSCFLLPTSILSSCRPCCLHVSGRHIVCRRNNIRESRRRRVIYKCCWFGARS